MFSKFPLLLEKSYLKQKIHIFMDWLKFCQQRSVSFHLDLSFNPLWSLEYKPRKQSSKGMEGKGRKEWKEILKNKKARELLLLNTGYVFLFL